MSYKRTRASAHQPDLLSASKPCLCLVLKTCVQLSTSERNVMMLNISDANERPNHEKTQCPGSLHDCCWQTIHLPVSSVLSARKSPSPSGHQFRGPDCSCTVCSAISRYVSSPVATTIGYVRLSITITHLFTDENPFEYCPNNTHEKQLVGNLGMLRVQFSLFQSKLVKREIQTYCSHKQPATHFQSTTMR